jgi:hypothetical protein
MKLTNKQLRQLIKEEVEMVLEENQMPDIFSSSDGTINKEVMTQYFINAADGDKYAAGNIYMAADLLYKKGQKFSPADGTPMNKEAVAKAYGVDPNNPYGGLSDDAAVDKKEPVGVSNKQQSNKKDFFDNAIKQLAQKDPEKAKKKAAQLAKARKMGMFK